MNTPSRFGTGGEAPAQPGFARVYFNGFLLGLGWMTALGLIGWIKQAKFNNEDENPVSEETEY